MAQMAQFAYADSTLKQRTLEVFPMPAPENLRRIEPNAALFSPEGLF